MQASFRIINISWSITFFSQPIFILIKSSLILLLLSLFLFHLFLYHLILKFNCIQSLKFFLFQNYISSMLWLFLTIVVFLFFFFKSSKCSWKSGISILLILFCFDLILNLFNFILFLFNLGNFKRFVLLIDCFFSFFI